MRIVITGGDGYIGWPLAMYAASKDHDVLVLDSLIKRKWVMEVGIAPLIQTPSLHQRVESFKEHHGGQIYFRIGTLTNHRFIYRALDDFQPDIVIHLASQASSPYSMKDRAFAVETMQNNLVGNVNLLFATNRCRNRPHLVLVGNVCGPTASMEQQAAEAQLPPNMDVKAGSFSDLSHFYQAVNASFLAGIWGLQVTEVKTGVVYGFETDEMATSPNLQTAFFYDDVFGTVVNRFAVQAAAEAPLTVFGDGTQERGFIHIKDFIRCLEEVGKMAPPPGQMRTVAAYTEMLSIKALAEQAQASGLKAGRTTRIEIRPNPRVEGATPMTYLPNIADSLKAPQTIVGGEALETLIWNVLTHRVDIKPSQLAPGNIFWHADAASISDVRPGFPAESQAGKSRFPVKPTKRKICFSTGKRGGFGALIPFLKSVSDDDDLELQLIVTDMHLHETFGKTAKEVGGYFNISRVVDMAQGSDTHVARTGSLGRCVTGMAQALNDLKPDIVLLLGDRSETLATAFASVEMGIPVAHVQAGDVSGGLDDIHRHSITKLAHLHFSQTEKQGQRVLALGEEPWRVFITGAPYVDRIVAGYYTNDPEVLSTKYGVDVEKPFLLILHHPDTYRTDESYDQMKAILNVVSRAEIPSIVCYPCSDPGFQGVIDAIMEIKGNPLFKVFYNIDSFDFLGLMRYAAAFVGNSSSGLIEAPYFNLPFVNVGLRQDMREKDLNVIDTETTEEDINKNLLKALGASFRETLKKSPPLFGDGTANQKIYEILKNVELGDKLFHKRVVVG